MPLTRRELLGAAAAGAGLAALPFGRRLSDPRAVAQSAPLGVAFDPAPFTLGVASGDPTGASVVLWTRLAPEPLLEGWAARSAHRGMPIPVPVGSNASFYFNLDQWDGYLAERRELTQFLATEQLPDTFVITGDIHSHWVQDVPADPDDDPGGPVVATEFVGTSITSDGFDDTFESSGGPPGSGPTFEAVARQAFYADNPQMRFFEGNQHGYAIVEVTRDAVTNTFRVISDRTDRYATVSTLAAFRRPRGDLLVTQVEGGMGNPRR